MTIGEIKKAVGELKTFCTHREKCKACPFRTRLAFGFNRCMFNPFGYNGAFPREWKVDERNVDD